MAINHRAAHKGHLKEAKEGSDRLDLFTTAPETRKVGCTSQSRQDQLLPKESKR